MIRPTFLLQPLNVKLTVQHQVNRNWSILLMGGFGALAVIVAMFALGKLTDVPLENLTRDPAAINHTKVYFGILTFINVVLWTVAVTASAVGHVLLGVLRLPSSSASVSSAQRQERQFLLFAAILTSLLLVDDILMLHEEIAPNYLGLSESLIYVFYGAYLFLFSVAFHRQIVKSDYIILLCAVGLMGGSILIDRFIGYNDLTTFIEDSLKFTGILFWAIYFVRYTIESVKARYLA